MGRVSLTEDYDDRSVIAKLNEMDKRVKENAVVVTSAEASAKQSAQAAQETADRFAGSVGAVVQNANAQINASKAQVDQAKAEVDAAVTTVEGYDTRLTAVEDADTQNVKLDGAQTINGDKTFKSITITTSTGNYNGGAVFRVPDSLSTTDIITAKNNNSASILNFRLLKDSASTSLMTMIRTPSNQQKYTVFQVNDDGTQVLRGPGPYAGAPSDSYVTKGYAESTDGVTNNLVHRSADETLDGIKSFKRAIIVDRGIPSLDQTPSTQVANDILSITTQGSNYPLFSNIHVYREPSGTNELSIDLMPTGWNGSFSKRIRLRITVDSNGVGHLAFYNGQRSVELA